MAENRAWKKLPDEQAWWWNWNGDQESLPYMHSVLASHTGETRYFVAGSGCWCGQIGGWWLKAEIPAPPTAVERAGAEAAWLKQFQDTMKADTGRVLEDVREAEGKEPKV